MGYHPDIEKITIDDFREILKNADLLPGRIILKENADYSFSLIKKQNIKNLAELKKLLDKKGSVPEFSKKTGLDENYLKILIREINSMLPKPNEIGKFPGISPDTVRRLEKAGIKNTLQLYSRILTPDLRNELSSATGIDSDDMLLLAKLADLSRIRWVNHNFAHMLLQTGYDTAEKVAKADPSVLQTKINSLTGKESYKVNIGLHDIILCVNAAKTVAADIKFR
ncbi:MAG: DUF4332 domain-containing protein [Spirochaetes bacterium]|nr:DUF4332 domain-containing protein [Spirochaetota bacterium]